MLWYSGSVNTSYARIDLKILIMLFICFRILLFKLFNKIFGFAKKHQNYLKLLEFMMSSEFISQIARAGSLKEL